MRRVSLLALLAAGCVVAPLASQTVAEFLVQRSLGILGDRPSMHIVLATGPLGLAWTASSYSGRPGPEPLRAAADRLAGCGQAPDDVLDVRIHVTGDWPWDVQILEATPGAEVCLEGVLSQLPLDANLSSGALYVAAKTTVAALRAPLVDEIDPPECYLSHHVGFRSTGGVAAQLPDVGAPAFAVTCDDDAPLTRLELRYARGALVEVRTDPVVQCVEDRAREALSAVADLRVRNPWPGARSGTLPTRLEDWDEVTCTLPVPLRAR